MVLNRLAKAAFAAVLGIASLWTGEVARAAGTVPLALSVQNDLSGAVASGCLLYFYQPGTVATPQNAYSDFGLTTPTANPLTCDQSGRLPMFWLADGLIHIRLTDSAGTPLVDTTMQVLGPSSGGGGGTTVDPTTILATGDEKTRYGTGPLSGFVRENGLTIGNAGSGATERANADTQALFIYLYGIDPNLAVSGGRTGNALNDYNANKQLTLPDMRGAINGFLADMGNSATSVLTATYCGTLPTVLGAFCGSQSYTMLPTNLPPYTPSGSVGFTGGPGNIWYNPGGALGFASGTGNGAGTGSSLTFTGTPAPGQNSTPFPTLPPMRLKTIYIKL